VLYIPAMGESNSRSPAQGTGGKSRVFETGGLDATPERGATNRLPRSGV
jgi:hypothetical protein